MAGLGQSRVRGTAANNNFYKGNQSFRGPPPQGKPQQGPGLGQGTIETRVSGSDNIGTNANGSSIRAMTNGSGGMGTGTGTRASAMGFGMGTRASAEPLMHAIETVIDSINMFLAGKNNHEFNSLAVYYSLDILSSFSLPLSHFPRHCHCHSSKSPSDSSGEAHRHSNCCRCRSTTTTTILLLLLLLLFLLFVFSITGDSSHATAVAVRVHATDHFPLRTHLDYHHQHHQHQHHQHHQG